MKKSYRPRRGDLIVVESGFVGSTIKTVCLVVECSKHPGTPLWSLTLLRDGAIEFITNKRISNFICMQRCHP
jgi:hypothetical protein